MQTNLKGKTAVITGGRRIGADIAEKLAELGVNIVLTYRTDPGELAETKNRCEAALVGHAGGVCELLQADVTHPDEIKKFAETVLGQFGKVDILINMASIYKKRDFASLTAKDFDEEIAVNVRGAFLLSQALLPAMRQNKWGRIINFSDWICASGRPNYTQEGYATYYVAKGAVIPLTEALALEAAGDNVLVNAIAPGPILPPPDLSEAELAEVAKATPVGRWGGAAEITKAVLFLLDTEFVTGQVIRVDGGRHLK